MAKDTPAPRARASNRLKAAGVVAGSKKTRQTSAITLSDDRGSVDTVSKPITNMPKGAKRGVKEVGKKPSTSAPPAKKQRKEDDADDKTESTNERDQISGDEGSNDEEDTIEDSSDDEQTHDEDPPQAKPATKPAKAKGDVKGKAKIHEGAKKASA